MKKNLLWMLTCGRACSCSTKLTSLLCTRLIAGLAAILICSFGMTSLTSCSNQDSPVLPPVDAETLTGDWLYKFVSSDDDDEMVGQNVSYSLLSFGDNGVLTQRYYYGNAGTSLEYWERWCRHSIYTVDEKAHTFTVDDLDGTARVFGYTLTDGQLIIHLLNGEIGDVVTSTLHRPEASDLEFLKTVDRAVWSDDYVGKWFGYTDWEDSGIRLYIMLDFTEDGIVNCRRYSVDKYNDCLRTVFSQYYEDYDNEDNMQMLMMHDSEDYNNTYLYKWSVVDNTLMLGDPEDSELDTVYHPLTPDDVAFMEELDKLVKE